MVGAGYFPVFTMKSTGPETGPSPTCAVQEYPQSARACVHDQVWSLATHCRIRAQGDIGAGRDAARAPIEKSRKISSERGWNADLLQHVPALVENLEIDAAPTSLPRYAAGGGELRVVRHLELRHGIERGPQLAGEQRGQLRLRARPRSHGLDSDLERQRGQRVPVFDPSAGLPLHPAAAAVLRPG